MTTRTRGRRLVGYTMSDTKADTPPENGNGFSQERASPVHTMPYGHQPEEIASGTVVGKLGQGGMSVVYEIWNRRLEIKRAVKLMRPTYAPREEERFDREMKITAQLEHPNIVSVHSVGEWNDLPYIEMEKIDGYSLNRLVETYGPQSPQFCTSISLLISRALEYAHNHKYSMNGKEYRGILHRDLKTANVMISYEGKVKLMDFGVAKPIDLNLDTDPGSIVGSFQYISPEQLQGEELDVRSDVYALGCMMYEMVTGRKAFPSTKITELVPMRLKNAFEPLSNFELTAPPAFTSLINACLEYAPAKRPATAETVVRRLEKIHSSLTEQSPERIVATHVRTALDSRMPIKKTSVRRNTDKLPLLIIAFLTGSLIGGLFPIATYRLAELFDDQTPIVSSLDTRKEHSRVDSERKTEAGNDEAEDDEAGAPEPSESSEAAELKPDVKAPSKKQKPEEVRSVERRDAVRPLSRPEQTVTARSEEPRKTEGNGEPDDNQVLPDDPRSPELLEPERRTRVVDVVAPADEPEAQEDIDRPDEPPTLVRQLKETYGTHDLLKVLRGEYSKGNYGNVLQVLDELPEPFRGSNLAAIYELRSLQGLNKLTPEFFKEHSISDGEFYLARAQIQYRREDYQSAIQWLDSAAVAPVLMGSLEEIRTQTLVCRARAYTGLFEKEPTMEHRHEALMSWRRVKENLRSVEAQIVEEAIRRIEMLQEDLPDRVIRSWGKESVARSN